MPPATTTAIANPFMTTPKTRQEIIAAMLRQREEGKQIFLDTVHWNTHVRQSHEAEVNPDPDGMVARIVAALERALFKELLCLHILGPDDVSAIRSLEEGDKRAAEFNAWAERIRVQHAGDENWPVVRAVIAPWPFDAVSHAADLLRQADEVAAQQQAIAA